MVGLVRWFLFLSGGCALINEVLWARALHSVLGGSHRVEALVLGVFFLAVPLGSMLGARWVRNAVATAPLLRRYALCEALTALSVLAPVALSRGILAFRGETALETAAAYAVLLTLLVPGGAVGAAWPLMVAIERASGGALGKLYSLNTLGSALGALVASFVLIERLGTSGGLLASATLGVALSAAALVLSRIGPSRAFDAPKTGARRSIVAGERCVWLAGTLSGFLALSFEVLGVRLLALRVPTTAYSLGLVLAVQLAGMALGARLAPLLLRRRLQSLPIALFAAAAGTAWAPLWASFTERSDADQAWLSGIGAAAWTAAVTIGPGAVTLGLLFPLASALLSHNQPANFARLGQLAALNGLAGAVGGVGLGLLVVPAVGLAATFALVVLAACFAALYIQDQLGSTKLTLVAQLAAAALTTLVPLRFSATSLSPGETLVAEVEGPTGVAAVVDDQSGRRRLVVNGRYAMGDNLSASVARRLALLPALLTPKPKRILLVGLGTGITRGAAQEVVGVTGGSLEVAELMTEIAQLTPHFSAWQARSGPAGVLRVADGRRVLRDSTADFDLVVFDVFMPWLPGAAHMFTEENLSLARARLSHDGTCVLWLPLYQLSPQGFATIVETFSSVFPDARIFAGGIDASRQVIALTSRAAIPSESHALLDSLRNAGVALDPLLTHPQGLAALDLGGAAAVLRALTASGFVGYAGVQRNDRPWLEFDSARAMGSGRQMRTEGFRQLLEASDRASGQEPTGLAKTLRTAWLGSPAVRQRVMHELSRMQAEHERGVP